MPLSEQSKLTSLHKSCIAKRQPAASGLIAAILETLLELGSPFLCLYSLPQASRFAHALSFIASATFLRSPACGSCATRLMAEAKAFQDTATL